MMERSSERNVQVFGNMVILFRENINLWEYIEYQEKKLRRKKRKMEPAAERNRVSHRKK